MITNKDAIVITEIYMYNRIKNMINKLGLPFGIFPGRKLEACNDILFKDVEIKSNEKDYYTGMDSVFTVYGSSNISTEDCIIEDNGSVLVEGDSELITNKGM